MQDGPNATLLPQMLADMCSKVVMPLGDSVQSCVGFDYQYDSGVAYFKTSDTGMIDISSSSVNPGTASLTCVRPNTVFWEQNSGEGIRLCYNPGHQPKFSAVPLLALQQVHEHCYVLQPMTPTQVFSYDTIFTSASAYACAWSNDNFGTCAL